MRRYGIFASSTFLLACIASPALAAEHWQRHHSADWRATHDAIYELENRIAFLEADPEMDDGYKAPLIGRARADIVRLRRGLRRAQWRWTSPCCYSRKPIYVR